MRFSIPLALAVCLSGGFVRADDSLRTGKDAHLSFYSRHASTTFAASVSGALSWAWHLASFCP